MSGHHGQPPYQYSGQSQDPDRTLAVMAHLSGLIAAATTAGALTFAGPLIVWLIARDRDPASRRAAAGAFNFAVTVSIAVIVLLVLTLVIFFTTMFSGFSEIEPYSGPPPSFFAVMGVPFLGMLLIGAVTTAYLVYAIVGAVKAGQGQDFHYPLQIPILK